MSITISYYGNPILRTKTPPLEDITDEVREVVREMIAWLHEHNGLGLAAPQVGQSWRLFITCFPNYSEDGHLLHGDKVLVYINPKLSAPSKETWSRSEACFSVPGVFPQVIRPVRITVEATDLEGNQFRQVLEGLPARIVMHENDHINGVLMIDRASAQERKRWDQALRKLAKEQTTHAPIPRNA